MGPCRAQGDTQIHPRPPPSARGSRALRPAISEGHDPHSAFNGAKMPGPAASVRTRLRIRQGTTGPATPAQSFAEPGASAWAGTMALTTVITLLADPPERPPPTFAATNRCRHEQVDFDGSAVRGWRHGARAPSFPIPTDPGRRVGLHLRPLRCPDGGAQVQDRLRCLWFLSRL